MELDHVTWSQSSTSAVFELTNATLKYCLLYKVNGSLIASQCQLTRTFQKMEVRTQSRPPSCRWPRQTCPFGSYYIFFLPVPPCSYSYNKQKTRLSRMHCKINMKQTVLIGCEIFLLNKAAAAAGIQAVRMESKPQKTSAWTPPNILSCMSEEMSNHCKSTDLKIH